jgi:hypothetical protein
MQQQGQQQSQLGNQTVGMMTNPPDVITDKDQLYLKDALSWELLAMKKCHHYAQMCQDQEVSGLIDRLGRMHQDHYQRLLGEVNPKKTLY